MNIKLLIPGKKSPHKYSFLYKKILYNQLQIFKVIKT